LKQITAALSMACDQAYRFIRKNEEKADSPKDHFKNPYKKKRVLPVEA